MNTKFMGTSFFAILMAITVLVLPKTVQAMPLDIVGSPQHIGGFTHNVFHTSVNGGGSGSILAWFDLDTGESNTYDPITGTLNAHFNLFNDSNFAQSIGNVWASGSLPAADFQGDGGIAGTITWSFNFDVDNALEDYLNGQSTITLTYLDQIYTSTVFGTDVNSWDDPYLSLWGSGALNGQECGPQQDFDCITDRQLHLGSDVVIETVHTPEPLSLALMASGLAGAFGFRKRKRM